MVRVADPVQHRVAHVDVRRRHVDLRAQHVRAVRELAGAHPAKRSRFSSTLRVAVRAARARLGQRAAVTRASRRRLAVHVRLAVVESAPSPSRTAARSSPRRSGGPVPLEPEPADVLLDRLDVLDVLLRGVRVVETQIAGAAELARRCRSSGRSTWRGRCADSRSARAETASRPAPPLRPCATSSATMVRMKSRGSRSDDAGSMAENSQYIRSPAPPHARGRCR